MELSIKDFMNNETLEIWHRCTEDGWRLFYFQQ